MCSVRDLFTDWILSSSKRAILSRFTIWICHWNCISYFSFWEWRCWESANRWRIQTICTGEPVGQVAKIKGEGGHNEQWPIDEREPAKFGSWTNIFRKMINAVSFRHEQLEITPLRAVNTSIFGSMATWFLRACQKNNATAFLRLVPNGVCTFCTDSQRGAGRWCQPNAFTTRRLKGEATYNP